MSNKKETPEQPITDISIYVAALSTTYRPASAPSRCSPHLSTQGSTSATAPGRTA